MKLNFNCKTIYKIIPLVVSVTFAQPELTLKQAISIALKQNYSIRIAENNYLITENNAHPGNAGLFPQLTLTSSATRSV
ncbi:MAG: TolC family protein, partial [Fidelibacterota bacterium]